METFRITQWKRPGIFWENFLAMFSPKKGSSTSALAGVQYIGSMKKLTDGIEMASGTSFLSRMSPREVETGSCAQYCLWDCRAILSSGNICTLIVRAASIAIRQKHRNHASFVPQRSFSVA
jgi:hypothetical protein